MLILRLFIKSTFLPICFSAFGNATQMPKVFINLSWYKLASYPIITLMPCITIYSTPVGNISGCPIGFTIFRSIIPVFSAFLIALIIVPAFD